MKKVEKGAPGYLDYKEKAEIIRTIVYFAIIAAVLLLGYSQTHTRRNLLTVIGILGCLPACKSLVGVITRLPYRSVSQELAGEVGARAERLTCAYDLVVTSTDKIMPIECIVISGSKVFGYASSPKVDLGYAADHIKTILKANQLSASVKLFDQYHAFLARVDGLENIAKVEKSDTREQDEAIRRVILNISL